MRSSWLLLFGAALFTVAFGCSKQAAESKGAAKTAISGDAAAQSGRKSTAKHERTATTRDAGKAAGESKNQSPRAPAKRGFAASKKAPKEFRPAPRMQERIAQPKPQIQSGTLTAGSLDDHARYAEFREFFSTLLQQPANRDLPKLSIGRRVEIDVRNDAGEPVGNARLVIRQADEGQDGKTVAEFPTGTDGRAVFLSGYDGGNSAAAFQVTATSHDGKRTVSQRFELKQAPWTITLPKAVAKLPTRLDLALVVDTTGSMEDELEFLKAEIDGIARAIHERYPNVDQRFALILYRDLGDRYVTRTFDFTGSIDEFRFSLNNQTAGGGGDIPEAVHLALEQSQRLNWRDGNTARVMFLIGDAPPHQRDEQQTLDSVRALRKQGVTLFPIAASGTEKRAEFLFRIAAFVTRGQYLFLTDHSGVGNPHAKPHAPRFDVERLDQLMIRMIASQLAGRKLLPRDIIANERTADRSAPSQQPRQRRSVPPPHLPASPSTHTEEVHAGFDFGSESFRWLIAVAAIAAILLLERLRT